MISPTIIFPWNENFETGIVVIDGQHRKLVELLNRLASHLAYGEDLQGLNQVFDELTAYALHHFQTEEAVWRKYLPEDEMSAEHHKTHQNFVTEVLKLKGEQDVLPTEAVIEDVVSFLTHWLAFHILEADKHMAKVVLALQQGMALKDAKLKASEEMSGAMRVLIETVLSMYDHLSSRTLQLMREIAERQRTEERLHLSRSVIDSTLEAVFITDTQGVILDTNPAFCLDAGREHEELLGMEIRQVKPDLFSQEKLTEIWQEATEKGHWSGELTGRDASGCIEAVWLSLSAVKDAQGVISHYVGLSSSISRLIQRQHSLEDAANYDLLTGLPNRRLLHDRLAQALIRSKRSGHKLAVCYLDLDGFKQVNDSHGHEAGDEVLRTVSRRLSKLLRAEDTVARIGGDEFVLLLGDLEQEEDAEALLNRLLSDIAKPILIDGTPTGVTASIGITLYPRDLNPPEVLLLHADEAMYVAKNSGKSRFYVYAG